MILRYLSTLRPLVFVLFAMAAAHPPSSPPPRSSGGDGPSNTAWLTLACGVVSWLFLPVIASIVGIFVGRGEIRAIEEGRSPQSGELVVKIGYYVCIANLALTVFSGCCGAAVFIAIWGGILSVGSFAVFAEAIQNL